MLDWLKRKTFTESRNAPGYDKRPARRIFKELKRFSKQLRSHSSALHKEVEALKKLGATVEKPHTSLEHMKNLVHEMQSLSDELDKIIAELTAIDEGITTTNLDAEALTLRFIKETHELDQKIRHYAEKHNVPETLVRNLLSMMADTNRFLQSNLDHLYKQARVQQRGHSGLGVVIGPEMRFERDMRREIKEIKQSLNIEEDLEKQLEDAMKHKRYADMEHLVRDLNQQFVREMQALEQEEEDIKVIWFKTRQITTEVLHIFDHLLQVFTERNLPMRYREQLTECKNKVLHVLATESEIARTMRRQQRTLYRSA